MLVALIHLLCKNFKHLDDDTLSFTARATTHRPADGLGVELSRVAIVYFLFPSRGCENVTLPGHIAGHYQRTVNRDKTPGTCHETP
jgi:hypothetical protein